MNLVHVESKTSREGKKISITMAKSGSLFLTKLLVETMSLEIRSRVSFHQDKDKPRDWYIARGGELEIHSFKGGSTTVNSTDIYRKLIDSLGLPRQKNYCFRVSPEWVEFNGEHYFPIITSKPL